MIHVDSPIEHQPVAEIPAYDTFEHINLGIDGSKIITITDENTCLGLFYEKDDKESYDYLKQWFQSGLVSDDDTLTLKKGNTKYVIKNISKAKAIVVAKGDTPVEQFNQEELGKLFAKQTIVKNEDTESFWSKLDNVSYWFSNDTKVKGTDKSDALDASKVAPKEDGTGVVIDGGKGSDILVGSWGNDTIFGGAGNDTIHTSAGTDIYSPGTGENVIDFSKNYAEGSASISGAQSTITLTKGSTVNITGLQFGESQGSKIFHDSLNKNDLMIIDKNENYITVKDALNTKNNAKLLIDGKDLSSVPLMDSISSSEITYYAKKTDKYTGSKLSDIIDGSEITEGFQKGLTIDGGAGSDSIKGTNSSVGDKIYGGLGNDTIIGGLGNDTINAGAGDNVFVHNLGDGNDVIQLTKGGNVDIQMTSITGFTFEKSKNGNDLILNNSSAGSVTIKNVLNKNTGAEVTLNGEAPVLIASVGNGKNVGTMIADYYNATDSSKGVSVNSRNGNDTIFGSEKSDVLKGGDGNDLISSQGGNDSIYGGKGNDTIFGTDEEHKTYIDAGDGDDEINSCGGADTIIGGKGTNTIKYDLSGETGFPFKDNTIILTESEILNIDVRGLTDISYDGSNKKDLVVTLKGETGEDGQNNGKIIIKDYLKKDINAKVLINGKDPKGGDESVLDPVDASKLLKKTDKGIKAVDKYKGTQISDVIDASKIGTVITTQKPKGLNLNGGGGNDTVIGSGYNDKLFGGNGNDVLYGVGGNNKIDGGKGDDELSAGIGKDSVYGGDGADSIFGGSGKCYLNGGKGDDYIEAGSGFTSISGGVGNDTVILLDGAGVVDGGKGNDFFFLAPDDYGQGYNTQNTLKGGAGDDTMYGAVHKGNCLFDGGAGNDYMTGGRGNDSILGGSGNDGIKGNMGNNLLDGGKGHDSIWGGRGSDSIIGGAGNDLIYGGTAELTGECDSISGGAGNDTISGGCGKNSVLDGGKGNDYLIAGTYDSEAPGIGSDTLIGGAGNDVMVGGYGNTTFKFGSNNGNDSIYGGSGTDNSHTLAFDKGTKIKSVGYTDNALNIKYTDPKKKTGNVKIMEFSDTTNIDNITIGGKTDKSIKDHLSEDNKHEIKSLDKTTSVKIIEFGGVDTLKINAQAKELRTIADVEVIGEFQYTLNTEKVNFVSNEALLSNSSSLILDVFDESSLPVGVEVVNKSSDSNDIGIEKLQLKNGNKTVTVQTSAWYDAIAQSVGAWLTSHNYTSVSAALDYVSNPDFDMQGLIQAFNVQYPSNK